MVERHLRSCSFDSPRHLLIMAVRGLVTSGSFLNAHLEAARNRSLQCNSTMTTLENFIRELEEIVLDKCLAIKEDVGN